MIRLRASIALLALIAAAPALAQSPIELYPTITGGAGTPHYDETHNVLTNVLGARAVLIGTAARDGVQWVNTYLPGVDASGAVQLYAIATGGRYAATFATRSSDNPGAAGQNVIGAVHLVVADNAARGHLHWASYDQGVITADSAFIHLINAENSIQNLSPHSPAVDPFTVNPLHLSNNLRLDCGVGSGTAHMCSNALAILPNGAPYRTGILFGADALALPVGEDADMIAAAPRQAITWYGAAGRPVWRITSRATGGNLSRIILGQDRLDITLGAATPLALDSHGATVSAMQAGGPPPALSGTCAMAQQIGGTTAGAMRLASACNSGQITLSLSPGAAHGWACHASDLTSARAALRQSGFTPATATLAITDAQAGDQITFACTGF